ncbi:MAG: hypothetical protein RLY29_729 [Actinomycetota bacterium]
MCDLSNPLNNYVMSNSKEKVSEGFKRHFGREPEVVAFAPGRVNLIGEHVDYNNGFVLPFAIDRRTYAALALREDHLIRIISAQRPSDVAEVSVADLEGKFGVGWARYVLGVIWALGIKNGLNIYIESDVPVGAGLSSSAALECSTATALNARFNLGKEHRELALLTQRAENEYVGVPCGIMDQSISLMGRADFALLLDCRDLSTRHVRVDFAAHGLKLLIIDTQAHHALVDGGYAERRSQCEAVARDLGVKSLRDLSLADLLAAEKSLSPMNFRRARHAVTEIQRVLDAVNALEGDRFEEFGRLLNGSHISLRDDYNVSCPELDLAVDTAIANGALGSRMVGGGFGGSAIALIRESEAGVIASSIERAFADASFKAPRFFDSLPSEGASVLS